jgi:formate hydrogenlyase subunit 3/multisubunit Na+/H+ antiporter MnhD subunit
MVGIAGTVLRRHLGGVWGSRPDGAISNGCSYSSVENVRIILLGIGTDDRLAENLPESLCSAFWLPLYHRQPPFFKALPFLGSGSVSFRTQTRNLNRWEACPGECPTVSHS